MEAIAASLVKALAEQGVSWLIVALEAIALAWVSLGWRDAERKCMELSNSLQEKRVNEKAETISVLHEGAQANQKLADSIAVRTETLNNLITVITSSNERLERMLADILKRLEARRGSTA